MMTVTRPYTSVRSWRCWRVRVLWFRHLLDHGTSFLPASRNGNLLILQFLLSKVSTPLLELHGGARHVSWCVVHRV